MNIIFNLGEATKTISFPDEYASEIADSYGYITLPEEVKQNINKFDYLVKVLEENINAQYKRYKRKQLMSQMEDNNDMTVPINIE